MGNASSDQPPQDGAVTADHGGDNVSKEVTVTNTPQMLGALQERVEIGVKGDFFSDSLTVEQVEASLHDILKKRDEIAYLMKVAEEQYHLVQELIGDAMHLPADSPEVLKLAKVFEDLEVGDVQTTPAALENYRKHLNLCHDISDNLCLAITDYRRLQELRGGTELTRYTYHSCRPKPGTLYLTESHLVWVDANPGRLHRMCGGLRFPLSIMREIIIGVVSNPLRYCKATGDKRKAPSGMPWLCFTIICTDRTCDFSVSDEDSLLTWIRGLSCVLDRLKLMKHDILSEEDIKARILLLKANHKLSHMQ